LAEDRKRWPIAFDRLCEAIFHHTGWAQSLENNLDDAE